MKYRLSTATRAILAIVATIGLGASGYAQILLHCDSEGKTCGYSCYTLPQIGHTTLGSCNGSDTGHTVEVYCDKCDPVSLEQDGSGGTYIEKSYTLCTVNGNPINSAYCGNQYINQNNGCPGGCNEFIGACGGVGVGGPCIQS